MPTPTVDVLVRDQIAANVGALTSGVNIFAGPMRSYKEGRVPHVAVFCLADGGLPSRALKGIDERRPRVRVFVRSDPTGVSGAFATGQQLARDVFDAIHLNPPAGVCESVATDSHPAYEGEDEDGHHVWIIFVDLIVDA